MLQPELLLKVITKVVLIPRIRLSPNAETLSVPLKRLQFPVRLAFSMTINKSQGQSVVKDGVSEDGGAE